MALELDLVLVPVDGSDEAARAVEYAVAVASEYDAEVHAVFVLSGEVAEAIERGEVEDAAVAADSASFFGAAREVADDVGVPLRTSTAYGFSTQQKLRHPGSVVLDTAETLDADFVVVPREPVAGDPDEVIERAAEYVLQYASQPVLSV